MVEKQKWPAIAISFLNLWLSHKLSNFTFCSVVTEAPFETAFSARYADAGLDINIPIHVYFKNPAEHKQQTFQYTIEVEEEEDQLTPDQLDDQSETTRCEKLIFWKPCEDFRKMLINAGGVCIYFAFMKSFSFQFG